MTANLLPISRTHQSNLAYLSNVVVWMLSILQLISSSRSSSCKPLETVPNAPAIVAIILTFMFHGLFSSLAWSKYCLAFRLRDPPNRQNPLDGKFSFFLFLFLFLINTRFGLLAKIR